MTWQEERARRRRAREMERQLRELDELDRRYGLGAPAPTGARPRRRSGGAGLTSVLLVLAVVGAALYLGAPRVPGWGEVLDRLTAAPGELGPAFTDGMDGDPDSGGEGYTFVATQADGVSPVTWPCEGTIPVQVNPQGAPQGYAELVGSAVERINEASGFTFEVVGETDDRTFLERGAGPVLLGFADEDEVPALAGPTAGLGGAVHAQRVAGGSRTAVGGMVVLDVDLFTDRVSTPVAEAIVIHELAHVLGLGHTSTGGELMQAVSLGQTQLGSGDLAGLRHLREAACS